MMPTALVNGLASRAMVMASFFPVSVPPDKAPAAAALTDAASRAADVNGKPQLVILSLSFRPPIHGSITVRRFAAGR